MNKIINSPIVIAILVVASLFILKAQTKPKVATEIRGAYEELMAIAEESVTEAEKTKTIQLFAEEIATQIREGFTLGFTSTNHEEEEKKESREEKFLRLREHIMLTEPQTLHTPHNYRKIFTYAIINNTGFIIKGINVNYEYYRDNILIDLDNDWISEIKALAPGESILIRKERNLHGYKTDEEREAMKHDHIQLRITKFDIVES